MAGDLTDDVTAVEAVVARFFAAFVSGPDAEQRLDDLRAVLLPEARIVRTCGGPPTAYDVEGFVAPRAALLADGSLRDFREWPTDGDTVVFGDAAQHTCHYAKSWVQDGRPQTGRGWKSIQLARTDAGWRITAVVWDDER